MFQQSSKQILLGIFVALLLITMPVYAVENYKVSNYGGGRQIWFEVEDFDERNPDTDEFYPVVDKAGALGQAINRAGGAGGMIRWTFDISKADGKKGTWLFWGRVWNPKDRSDFMLVEGDPDDAGIPTDPPFEFDFNNDDHRIFEEDDDGWFWSGGEQGHIKELQAGENTMCIFHRQGDERVFWDVFVWSDSPDYVPTDEDYQNALIGPPTTAYFPSPADGTILRDTWAILGWSPIDFAVSHDVYFGENFDNVNDGAAEAFYGNQASTEFVIGFSPYPYPDGLVPGTTYYWRIDEVNDLDPNSPPLKGPIWSFSLAPKTAYDPDPANCAGLGLEDLENITLGWERGFGAMFSHVYFGDNFADVTDGTGDTYKGTVGVANYSPGILELAKAYYWRIDEFDGIAIDGIIAPHKGDVWCFTTPVICENCPQSQ